MRRTVLFLLPLFLLTVGTSPADAATGGSCPQYEKEIARYFPSSVVKTMSRLAHRESRCNPRSVSAVRHTGYPDVGFLQVQGSWRSVTYAICKPKGSHIKALTNLDCNLRVARYLYDNGGLGHWRGTSKR